MERIKWLCSKALLHVCAFMDMDCASPTESLRTHKNIFIVSSWGTSFYHADFPPLLSQRFWRKNSSILPSPPPYLLKSHFIKVMDSTSNKIATAAIIARHWRHAAGRTKYHSPFNVYDLQNLLQVHTVIKGGKKKYILSGLCWEAPWGVYLTLTVNQCYQPPSDNAFIIKFHICISIWGRKWALAAHDKSTGDDW